MKARTPPPPPPPASPSSAVDSNPISAAKPSRAVRAEYLRGLRQELKWPTQKPALVEVTSDEEGFKGAWYLATLLHLPLSTSPASALRRKYGTNSQANAHQAYVEYHNLVVEEGSDEPLREYVDVEFIRPTPPSTSTEEHFQIGDIVDAYVRDGWWTGVVTGAILEELRFIVSFQNPPDEISFGISELRFHHQWVNRQWVRPERQRVTGLIFSKGKKVEVSFDREDRRDAWFPATILEDAGNGCYLVEHEILKKGADGVSERVKATVDSLHLRPCPPHLKDGVFHALEKVDAKVDFAWQSGMITRELENNHYLVYFKQNQMEKEFNSSQLRLHMEWKNGNWFTSQNNPKHSDLNKLAGPVCIDVTDPEITVPLNKSKEKMVLSLNLNEVDSSDSYEELPRISPTLKEKTQEDSLSASCGKGISKGEISIVNTANTDTIESVDKMKLIEYVSPSPESSGNLDGNHSDGHTSGKSIKRRRSKTSQDDAVGSDGGNGGSKKLHISGPSNQVGGMEAKALRDAAKVVKDGRIRVSTNLPVILGLESDHGSNSTAKKTFHLHSEEVLRHAGLQCGINDNEPARIKVRVLKNKMDPLEQDGDQLEAMIGRVQPLGGDTRSPMTSLSGDSTKDSVDEPLGKHFLRSDSLRDVEIKSARIDFSSQQLVINDCGRSKNINQAQPTFINLDETSVEVPITVQDKRSSKRGRRRTVSINAVSHLPVGKLDSPRTSAGKSTESNSTAEEMEIVSSELPAKPFEDQPLAKWIKGMHPPIDDNASKVLTSKKVEQSAVVKNALPQTVEKSGQQQIVEESGHAQATKERGEAQAIEESGQAQATEESGQAQATEESSLPRTTEESNQLQAREESRHPQMIRETSEPQRVDESRQPHGVEESLGVDKGTNVGDEAQALPFVKNTSDIGGNELQALHSVKNTCNGVGNKFQVLPFVKNTSLWSTLESMEVFKKFPQTPHFRPLENCKESLREGLAIGYMVNFCSVVERTSKLQLDDSRSTIDDILDTLSELEGHGFNVQALQNHVNDLVDMQGKEKKLREEFEQLNGEMEKQNLQRIKIDEEMDEINKQIMALQEKISQTRSAKESKDRRIASLQLKIEGLKENMMKMECDFRHSLV